jgi:hypothetical protein
VVQLRYDRPVNYDSYIRSVQWKRVRGEYLKRVGWKCERCYTRQARYLHHLTYVNLGHEEPNDLMALCYECHESMHRWPKPANDNIKQLELSFDNDNGEKEDKKIA